MSTAEPSEGIRSFLLSVRKLLVSLAAEASIADYGGLGGWEWDSGIAEVILPQCCDCTDSTAGRESVLCSLREGVISEGTETSRVNNSFHDFFMV